MTNLFAHPNMLNTWYFSFVHKTTGMVRVGRLLPWTDKILFPFNEQKQVVELKPKHNITISVCEFEFDSLGDYLLLLDDISIDIADIWQ